jgi:hypothetical protein
MPNYKKFITRTSIPASEWEAVVKKWSGGKQGHIILPLSMRGEHIIISLDDQTGTITAWASAFGNSAHVMVDGALVGKRVKVRVIDDAEDHETTPNDNVNSSKSIHRQKW